MNAKYSLGGLRQQMNWGAAPSAGEGRMFRGVFWVEGSDDSYASLNALEVDKARMKELVKTKLDKDWVANRVIVGSI